MPKKILVVDDEEDVITYLCTLLEEHGFHASYARNCAQGLKKITEEKPDLVCLDILLEGESGIRMYEELKRDDRFVDIPVLFVTGYKLDDPPILELQKTLEEHSIPSPEGYIEKPIGREVFIQEVKRIVGSK